MRLRETPEEQAFRAELRAWLDATLPGLPAPPPFDDWAAKRAYDTGWQRRLHDAGYAGISWPKEYGGRGATPSEELIFLEESERAGAPYVGCNFVSTLHAWPTIGAEGTPDPVSPAGGPGRRPGRPPPWPRPPAGAGRCGCPGVWAASPVPRAGRPPARSG